MSVRSGQVVTVQFITSSFTTGEATAADSLPSAGLYINGSPTISDISVTDNTGGRYAVTVTLIPMNIGDIAEIIAFATVGGRAGAGVIWRDTKDLNVDANGNVSSVDPLLSTVPGSYSQGSAGYALGRIGTGRIATVSPVSATGDVEIVKGDGYPAYLGRALDWTDAGAETAWPDLTFAVIELEIDDGALVVAGSVVTPTGTTKKVRAEPTGAQTGTLTAGQYSYSVVATFSGTGTVRVTLARGLITVVDREDT